MGIAQTLTGTPRRRIVSGAGVVLLLAALAVAWWLGSPLFINRTVNEEFPFSVNAVVPESMTQQQVEDTMATMALMDFELSEAMPEARTPSQQMVEMALEMMGEVLPELIEGIAEVMDEMASEVMSEITEGSAPEGMSEIIEGLTPETMIEAVGGMVREMMEPASPSAVKSGSFRDADSFHRGSGSAVVYRLPDGSHVLRLEEFRVTNGPDLRVLLAAHPDPEGRSDVQGPGYVELGRLKGNIGNQNYTVPDEVNVSAQMSVVIYCKPFSVIFSVAPLVDSG